MVARSRTAISKSIVRRSKTVTITGAAMHHESSLPTHHYTVPGCKDDMQPKQIVSPLCCCCCLQCTCYSFMTRSIMYVLEPLGCSTSAGKVTVGQFMGSLRWGVAQTRGNVRMGRRFSGLTEHARSHPPFPSPYKTA